MIRCRVCGFEMAMNLSLTWDEQLASGCPKCAVTDEWWTGWPADGGPWQSGDWQAIFEEQRANWLAADRRE